MLRCVCGMRVVGRDGHSNAPSVARFVKEKHIPTHPGVPSDASAPSKGQGKGARGKGGKGATDGKGQGGYRRMQGARGKARGYRQGGTERGCRDAPAKDCNVEALGCDCALCNVRDGEGGTASPW